MKPKPKILFLVHDYYDALVKKGVDHMILERDEGGFFEKVITVHPLAYKNQKIKLNDRHMLYEFDLRKILYPTKLSLSFLLTPVKFIFILKKLVTLIRKEKIDLIRATDPYLMGLIAWILSRISKIPFCISLHSDYPAVFSLDPRKGLKKWIRTCAKWIPDFVSPKAQLILPISFYLKKAVSNKVRDENIRVISHGIDMAFKPDNNIRTQFSLPVDKKIISFVARLSKDNYIDDILNVIERLMLIRSDFMLVMVGGGEMESAINTWISNRPDAQSFIRLLGFQPNHIGRSLRYISDISLCLMSGFSLIEAAAAATPLISYDIEWHKELVKNKVTGFLIDEHNLEGVVNSICYLLDNPTEAVAMGLKAKQKAVMHHDIVKTSYLKQSYYSELLKETANDR